MSNPANFKLTHYPALITEFQHLEPDLQKVVSGQAPNMCKRMSAKARLADKLLAARNRRAACQVFVAVGRLPVVRGHELRTLKKPYPAEIRLVEVGAIDIDLE